MRPEALILGWGVGACLSMFPPTFRELGSAPWVRKAPLNVGFIVDYPSASSKKKSTCFHIDFHPRKRIKMHSIAYLNIKH